MTSSLPIVGKPPALQLQIPSIALILNEASACLFHGRQKLPKLTRYLFAGSRNGGGPGSASVRVTFPVT